MAADANVDPNFTIVMRGYERDEVDAYLRDLVAETTRLGQRVNELESELESARRRAEAGGGPEEGFKQLGEETTRILVAAETAAREMREKAERQADAELAAAEKAARERVESASEHADHIVAEAEARQRDVESEIRRLEAVRAELVDSLRGAISTTEQAIASTPPVDMDREAPSTPPVERGSTTRPAASPFEHATDDEDDLEVEPAPGDTSTPTEAAPSPSETQDEAATATEATEPSTEVASEPIAGSDEPTGTDATSAPAAAAVESPAAEAAEAPAAERPATEAEPAPGGADRGALAAALAEADAAAGRTPPASAAAPDTAAATDEADAGMLRERSLAGVRPGMLRRLRRSLQELQNGVLESVRTRGEDAPVEDLLPASGEAASLADVARVFLDAGYRAGRADAPALLGEEPLQDPPTDTTLVGDTAEDLAEELLDELRTTLAPSLRAGVEADEPDASLSERVGEVFRDLKGPIVETVVDRHLTRTYGRATLDGWSGADVEQVTWVLGEEARCPEGMCRANQSEGAVELGDDFPSGHDVPPAHEGCTCALDPV